MFQYLQRIGKSLMVPVAVLPAAAVLMGIGYWLDPVSWGGSNVVAAFLIKSGASLIDNMGILFAVGVAYGMAKDHDGAAALTGLTAWLVLTTLLSPGAVAQLKAIPIEEVSPAFGKIQNQFIGILCGIIAAEIYNRFHRTELPAALAFFSGKRLAPIITGAVMVLVSFLLMYVWPAVFSGLVAFGIAISKLGAVGAGIYGFLNRILLPVGLHHALNAVFWFDIAGINDIGNFWSGNGVKGVTGMYQAGFFPIMMFGLVGACVAFVSTARPERKKQVASIMMAAGFASFFTGVTEPIEFSFMFLAPGLYVLHAVLTGLSLFIAAMIHATAGFGFSAGLIDFILSSRLPLANKPYLLLLQGVVFFAVYFVLFRLLIQWLNLQTPGREDDFDEILIETDGQYSEIARRIFDALGGNDNIGTLDYCATRLRFGLVDSSKIDEQTIKSVALGILKPDNKSAQIIIGPNVQFVADEIKKLLKS